MAYGRDKNYECRIALQIQVEILKRDIYDGLYAVQGKHLE